MDWMLQIVTLELAAAASCMPSQADWLNDLSLMPPVSVTMQASRLPPAAADVAAGAEVAAELLELVELLDGAFEELLPHAASSRIAAALAVAVKTVICLKVSSTGPGWDETMTYSYPL